jgi:hypothetical protein
MLIHSDQKLRQLHVILKFCITHDKWKEQECQDQVLTQFQLHSLQRGINLCQISRVQKLQLFIHPIQKDFLLFVLLKPTLIINILIAKFIAGIPGPGSYHSGEVALNKTGSYFLSKFRNSFSRTFGIETRTTLKSAGGNASKHLSLLIC